VQTQPPSAALDDALTPHASAALDDALTPHASAARAEFAEEEILSATRQLIAEAAAQPDRFGDAAEAAAKLRRTAQLGTAEAAELLSWATTQPTLAQVRCEDGGDLLALATEALVGMGHPHALLVDPNALEYARHHGRPGGSSIQAVIGWILQLSAGVTGAVMLVAAAIEIWSSWLGGLLPPAFLIAVLLAGVLVPSKKKGRRALGLVLGALADIALVLNGLLLPTADERLLADVAVVALAIGLALLAAAPTPPERH
jgi:hypothetical protein